MITKTAWEWWNNQDDGIESYEGKIIHSVVLDENQEEDGGYVEPEDVLLCIGKPLIAKKDDYLTGAFGREIKLPSVEFSDGTIKSFATGDLITLETEN